MAKGGLNAVKIVQRHFPKVTKIIEAKENLEIEVLPVDDKNSKRRDHEACAMAVACKRAYKADGVIISRSVEYLVKDNLAVRFFIPESVSREIVSFDRGGAFNPGVYHLRKPSESDTLGYRQEVNEDREEKHGHTDKRAKKAKLHRTQGIRAILGSAEDK